MTRRYNPNKRWRYHCPICKEVMLTENGEEKREADKRLVMYRKPNGTLNTCCEDCYQRIDKAHERLIHNILYEAEQKRKYAPVKQEKGLTLPTECDSVCV